MEARIGFKYAFSEGPTKTSPDALLSSMLENEGNKKVLINCQLYVASVLRALGLYVPDYYRSAEFFFDPNHCLRGLEYPTITLQQGDIFGLSKNSDSDPKKIHLGVGREGDNHTLEILHISRETNGIEATTIENIIQNEKYGNIRFVKRPLVFNPDLYNQSALLVLKFLKE